MRSRFVVVLASIAASVAVAAPSALADDDAPMNPMDPITKRGDRYVPKPAGTKEKLRFFFGPYAVAPGHDGNRIDVDLPLANGMITSVEPGMRRVHDGKEPSHQEGHIHHAHWFGLDPGNEQDNYLYGFGEWIFGNGDEETKADFAERTAADPNGPIYGQHIGLGTPQAMIYMLHNKTSKPLVVYIVLDVTFIHGTMQQLQDLPGRDYHNITGVLFGRTFDVPRNPLDADKRYTTTDDHPNGAIEWVSTVDGTMIGTGGHLHPGGLSVIVENMGSKENPCADDGRGFGGTQLLKSDAVWRGGVRFSEDFQMEVTNPHWRAPIHKGDRIRITGIYENTDHAWYTAMTHEGIYIDEAQPPQGRCKPYLIGDAAKPRKMSKSMKARCAKASTSQRRSACRDRMRRRLIPDPTVGVPNRPWGKHRPDLVCGENLGASRCDRPEQDRGKGQQTSTVTIANFLYMPGDRALTGAQGAPARIKQGQSLQFVNLDQFAMIRHSVTTCPWPCNGPYVANYPLADGRWDSGTMGYDLIDGGSTNPIAKTPTDLPVGKYSYFCRIHPWMRGAFEVEP